MLTLLSIACIPAGTYPLQALSNPEASADFLSTDGTAEVVYDPTRGWDLLATITLRNDGQGSPRIDLVHSHVRVNGMAWASCSHPDDRDQERLFVTLSPGEEITQTLICEDIPQPGQGLELRFGATHAGGRGVVELGFAGVQP